MGMEGGCWAGRGVEVLYTTVPIRELPEANGAVNIGSAHTRSTDAQTFERVRSAPVERERRCLTSLFYCHQPRGL